jgi:[ribosomal protein S5]-alanine N-acetyltransferase
MCSKIINSNQHYQTDRLKLYPVSQADADFFHRYLKDPELTRFLPLGQPYPNKKIKIYIYSRILHWQKHQFGTFIIEDKDSQLSIGYVGLEYVLDSKFIDIRYGLIQNFQGKGLVVEAAKKCLEIGFNVWNIDVIYGAAVPENKASVHILEKIGMKSDQSFDIYGKNVLSFSFSSNRFKETKSIS